MLGRLAELYECSVGDLLLDYGNFRSRDAAYSSRKELNQVHEVATAVAAHRVITVRSQACLL